MIQTDQPDSITRAFDEESQETDRALTPELKADAFCSLAQELTWAGKIDEALSIAREAAELNPKNAWVLCQYGRLLERTNDDDDAALRVYQRAVELSPDEALALARLGQALLRRGDLVEARDFLRKAVNHPADSAAPLSFRVGVRISYGDSLRQLGDLAAARRQYEDAYRLAPNSDHVRDRLSQISKLPHTPGKWDQKPPSSSPFRAEPLKPSISK